MAECNKQAVEDVKRNIESQIASLQKEIDSMNQTISRLSSCNGTKENPHNHSSEIGSLRSQISANQSTIEQLRSLLKAVMDAKTTMEEADRRLRELVEEYQQGKTKRMTLTSAMLSVNMECLEEKHKAGMISEEEYNQHFKKLSEMYISSLQSEINTLTSNMEGLDACDPEYSGLLSRTTEKRKELISFVEEHNFSYPVSAKEIEAIKITNIIKDLTEQYNNSISNEQKSAIWKTMQERRKQLEEIDSKLSNELLQIVTISKELNAEKVTSQVFDRLIPVAIRSTNETAVNACIDYKLKDVDGETRDEKLENYFKVDSQYSYGYWNITRNELYKYDKNAVLLNWICRSKNDQLLPPWWQEKYPNEFITQVIRVDFSTLNRDSSVNGVNTMKEELTVNERIAVVNSLNRILEENSYSTVQSLEYTKNVMTISPELRGEPLYNVNIFGFTEKDEGIDDFQKDAIFTGTKWLSLAFGMGWLSLSIDALEIISNEESDLEQKSKDEVDFTVEMLYNKISEDKAYDVLSTLKDTLEFANTDYSYIEELDDEKPVQIKVNLRAEGHIVDYICYLNDYGEVENYYFTEASHSCIEISEEEETRADLSVLNKICIYSNEEDKK